MGLWHQNHKSKFTNSFPRNGTNRRYAIVGLCFARESPGNSDPRSSHYCRDYGFLCFGHRPPSPHFFPVHHWLAGPVCRYLPWRTFSTGSRTGSSIPEGGSIHSRWRISISHSPSYLHPTVHQHFWTAATITRCKRSRRTTSRQG